MDTTFESCMCANEAVPAIFKLLLPVMSPSNIEIPSISRFPLALIAPATVNSSEGF